MEIYYKSMNTDLEKSKSELLVKHEQIKSELDNKIAILNESLENLLIRN
jgi:hypothetical protein